MAPCLSEAALSREGRRWEEPVLWGEMMASRLEGHVSQDGPEPLPVPVALPALPSLVESSVIYFLWAIIYYLDFSCVFLLLLIVGGGGWGREGGRRRERQF